MLRTSLTTISVHIHWNERGSYFVNRFECWSSKRNLKGTVNWSEVSHLQRAATCVPWHRLLIGLHDFKVAFKRQINVSQLVLTNSNWCVCV